jgi:divalent metal cation (Fe/Co/Zn/Cd) transporter
LIVPSWPFWEFFWDKSSTAATSILPPPYLIGLLLAAVALLLGRESGALLVGERTNRARIRRVRKILEEDPAVEAVGDILTMQMGPDQVLLTVEIRVRRGLDVQQVESAIDRLEARIRQQEPTIQKIFIEPDSLKTPARKSSKAA